MYSYRKTFEGIKNRFRVSRIQFIVDVYDLSDTIRIIAIYWPICHTRTLENLEPYIIENTIITGEFNAAIFRNGFSDSTDKRGRNLKEWMKKQKKESLLHSIDITIIKTFEEKH